MSPRDTIWAELRSLRDYARQRVGKRIEVSSRLLSTLENAVVVFQSNPPCPECGKAKEAQ